MLFGRHENHIHYFRTLKGVVGMLAAPEHTESVFDIEDGLREIEASKRMIEHLRGFSEVREMIDSRWLAQEDKDLDRLGALAEGSLGRVFADHIRTNGFDPDYYRRLEIVDDVTYVMMRVRQTHDLWHCLTGFGVDRIGELALKAFELAQLRRPMAAVITSGGVLRFLLKDPDQLGEVLRGISQGYRLGLAAHPLLACKWEEDWEKPVAQWRAELNIDPDLADPDRVAYRPEG